MIQGQGELQREFFRAYGYADKDIDLELRRALMLLTILYEESNLRKYALRLRPEAVNYSLCDLERSDMEFCRGLSSATLFRVKRSGFVDLLQAPNQ